MCEYVQRSVYTYSDKRQGDSLKKKLAPPTTYVLRKFSKFRRGKATPSISDR